jgi:L-alanine-DL-glutamate epimerase-like enolase superfamily enzyme
MALRAVVRAESWPVRGEFRIARGARRTAEVVVVELHREGAVGRGECVPYARYGESIDSVRSSIEAAWPALDLADGRRRLQAMKPGAARNALDCALWDLEAKLAHEPVWRLLGFARSPGVASTMQTVSVATPEQMHEAASRLARRAVLKVKVDGGADLERIAAVHQAAPRARLVVDANESWTASQLERWLGDLPRYGVDVLEQPLSAGSDRALAGLESPVRLCADESFHDLQSFDAIERRYDMVNVKLDKAGGLTEALRCVEEARRRGLSSMVGCMVSTSLAIEPALLLAGLADYVDLDGPLLLEVDREGALHDADAGLLVPSPRVWGGP